MSIRCLPRGRCGNSSCYIYLLGVFTSMESLAGAAQSRIQQHIWGAGMISCNSACTCFFTVPLRTPPLRYALHSTLCSHAVPIHMPMHIPIHTRGIHTPPPQCPYANAHSYTAMPIPSCAACAHTYAHTVMRCLCPYICLYWHALLRPPAR